MLLECFFDLGMLGLIDALAGLAYQVGKDLVRDGSGIAGLVFVATCL